jgi:hypothetical protein
MTLVEDVASLANELGWLMDRAGRPLEDATDEIMRGAASLDVFDAILDMRAACERGEAAAMVALSGVDAIAGQVRLQLQAWRFMLARLRLACDHAIDEVVGLDDAWRGRYEMAVARMVARYHEAASIAQLIVDIIQGDA